MRTVAAQQFEFNIESHTVFHYDYGSCSPACSLFNVVGTRMTPDQIEDVLKKRMER